MMDDTSAIGAARRITPDPWRRLSVWVLRGACLTALLIGPGARLRAASRETWVEVRSPHFIAYSDAGEAEARKTLEGFEAIRGVFTLLMPGLQVDLHKPTVILATADERSMRRFAPGQFEGKDPKRSAGIFNQGQDRNYVLLRLDVSHQADQAYFVVFHEYTHQVVHQNFPMLPTWLDEGIADYYGTTELHAKQIYLGRLPLGHLATLRRGRMPLKELLTATHDSPHYQEGSKAGTFYAQSWALTHYLFMDEEARKTGLLAAYLRALSHTSDPLAAAQEGFGDLGKLEGALATYCSRPRYAFWALPLKLSLTDKDFVARPLGEAEALVLRAEYLLQHRHEKEALSLLEQARALSPKSPEVQTGWGLACQHQGRYEEARVAFQEALALGSDDFRPSLHLAKMAQGHHLAEPPGSQQILDWLEVARSHRPDFPGIHMALCWEYARDAKEPQKALQEGFEAVKLEPRDLAIRMNLGAVLMRMEREADAIKIWEQLAQMAQTATERERIGAYKTQLDQFLASRALGASRPADMGALEPGGSREAPAQPLKFSLPSYYAPLGQEVIQLVSEGKQEVAIRKVEKALAAATNAYDQKALQALLDTLRGKRKPK